MKKTKVKFQVLPTTKAVYLNTLTTPEDGLSLGQVVAIAFLPGGDIVTLTLPAKVRVFGTEGGMKYEFGDGLQQPSDMVSKTQVDSHIKVVMKS